jgi:hypothetical protein
MINSRAYFPLWRLTDLFMVPKNPVFLVQKDHFCAFECGGPRSVRDPWNSMLSNGDFSSARVLYSLTPYINVPTNSPVDEK